MPSSGPNTAEWISAGATLALAVFGLGAIWQLGEARRTRSRDTVRRLSEHWHSPEVISGRKLLKKAPQAEDLIFSFNRARDAGSDDYYSYLRILDFFEEVGYSHRRRSQGFSSVDGMLGDITIRAWARWKPVIDATWPGDDDAYRNFRLVAEKLARWRRFKARRHTAWLQALRVLRWMVTSDYNRYPR
jgi:hypothetical protein